MATWTNLQMFHNSGPFIVLLTMVFYSSTGIAEYPSSRKPPHRQAETASSEHSSVLQDDILGVRLRMSSDQVFTIMEAAGYKRNVTYIECVARTLNETHSCVDRFNYSSPGFSFEVNFIEDVESYPFKSSAVNESVSYFDPSREVAPTPPTFEAMLKAAVKKYGPVAHMLGNGMAFWGWKENGKVGEPLIRLVGVNGTDVGISLEDRNRSEMLRAARSKMERETRVTRSPNF